MLKLTSSSWDTRDQCNKQDITKFSMLGIRAIQKYKFSFSFQGYGRIAFPTLSSSGVAM